MRVVVAHILTERPFFVYLTPHDTPTSRNLACGKQVTLLAQPPGVAAPPAIAAPCRPGECRSPCRPGRCRRVLPFVDPWFGSSQQDKNKTGYSPGPEGRYSPSRVPSGPGGQRSEKTEAPEERHMVSPRYIGNHTLLRRNVSPSRPNNPKAARTHVEGSGMNVTTNRGRSVSLPGIANR